MHTAFSCNLGLLRPDSSIKPGVIQGMLQQEGCMQWHPTFTQQQALSGTFQLKPGHEGPCIAGQLLVNQLVLHNEGGVDACWGCLL